MSDIYYIIFMFMMANLMLWLFLAIFFDTYTEVRQRPAPPPFVCTYIQCYHPTRTRVAHNTSLPPSPQVRAESHRGPSAVKELVEVLSSANEWAPRFVPHLLAICPACCGCRGRAGSGNRGTGRGATARDDATLAEVLYEATKGSLRLDARITQLSLVHALGLTESAAAKLIHDAAVASTRFQSGGDPDHHD